MTEGMAAVHAVLAGQIPDAIPVNLTASTWTCRQCDQVLLIPLGPTDPDGWLEMLGHECHTG